MDLLEFDPAHERAVLRAFGGYVVAASDAAAARLVAEFGLSSVTLDGKISQKGSLQASSSHPGLLKSS